ncbi:flagellar motor switch protein FliM [Paracoccus aminophilus]|nr:flagellar motor switch protein FliM [Paracoccus aminophilus]
MTMTDADATTESGTEETGADAIQPSRGPSHAEILRRLLVERPSETFFADAPAPLMDLPIEPVSPARGAAVALGRVADKLYGLAIFVESVEEDSTSVPELAELFPDRSLLAVVHGGSDSLGVVALCPSLIASLIEVQAIGRVSSRQLRPRRPTRTDASISADFVTALLAELGKEIRGVEGPDYGGFSYASYLDDPRPLMLMLEEVPFTRLTLRFRIGQGGQRDGTILIALPQTPAAPVWESGSLALPEPDLLSHAEIGTDEPIFSDPEDLAAQMRNAPVSLVGVLCRRKMSLKALRGLGPGDVIPLTNGSLDTAQLETESGQVLATGRLGEAEGFHAIRLHGAAHTTVPAFAPPQLSDGAAAAFGGEEFARPDADPEALPTIDFDEPDSFRSNDQEQDNAQSDAFSIDEDDSFTPGLSDLSPRPTYS